MGSPRARRHRPARLAAAASPSELVQLQCRAYCKTERARQCSSGRSFATCICLPGRTAKI
eukprot:3436002-Prymnesium_polylepis.2